MKQNLSDALVFITFATLLVLPGCAHIPAGTNQAAEQQVLTDVYNGAAQATTASLASLSGPNAQNGQDVAQAAWIAAGESTAINAVGQLLVDYGGPEVTALSQWVNTELAKLPTSQQSAAKNTIAAAIQNTVNAAAVAPAQ